MKKILIIFLFFFSNLIILNSNDLGFLKNINKKTKTVPDTATNLVLFQFVHYVPVNSNIICYGYSRYGSDGKDTTFTRDVFVKVFEHHQDSSLKVRNIFNQDTFFISPSKGDIFFYIFNADTELVSLKIEDSFNSIKSSFQTVYKFVLKADTVTKIKDIEDTFLTVNSERSIFINYVDDFNKIFFDYGTFLQDSTFKVTIIDDNKSIQIGSLGEYSDSFLYPKVINGGYFLQVKDSEVEDFYLVFEPLLNNIYPLKPETVHFVSLPATDSRDYYVISTDGYKNTRGLKSNLISINFGEDGPNGLNNSSLVKTNLYDLTGNGGIISNNGWQTLASGIAQFYIQNNVPNECIVLENLTSGTPQLVNNTKFCVFEYKDFKEAVKGKIYGDRVSFVGETLNFNIRITDGYDSIDNAYNGFASLNTINDLYFLNSLNGFDDYIEIQNGEGFFKLYSLSEGTKNFSFNDGELNYINNYYSTGIDGQGEVYVIDFYNPTNISANKLELFLPKNRIANVNENVLINVVAMNGNMIDTTNNSTVYITKTGSAILSDTIINLVKGKGAFFVYDNVSEKVLIDVTSGGLQSDQDTLNFLSEEKAVMIFNSGNKYALVNEPVNFSFYAMTPSFSIDTNFTGYIKISVKDSNQNFSSTVFINYSSDSIPIKKGVGNVSFYNMDPESIYISGYGISSSDTIMIEPFYFKTTYKIVGENKYIKIGVLDTIKLMVNDYYDSLKQYTTVIDSIKFYESNINGSLLYSFGPYNVVNGLTYIQLFENESENIDLYILTNDTFISNSGIYQYIGTYSSLSGIFEKFYSKKITEFKVFSPYYEKDRVSFKFQIPYDENLKISVYDVTGRFLNEIYNDKILKGEYIFKYDYLDRNNNKLPKGKYFVLFRFGNKFIRGISFLK